jgi:hypothetical protein
MFNLDLGGLMTSSLQSAQQLGMMKEQVGLYKEMQGSKAEIDAETARLANVEKTDVILAKREASIEDSMALASSLTTPDPWLVKLIEMKQARYEATSLKNT